MPDDTLSPSTPTVASGSLRRLSRYLLHAPGRLVLVVAFSLTGTFLALVPAVLVGVIINGPILINSCVITA